MSAMGVKIDLFDVPVCTSFKAKVLNDQLCYEVDLEKLKSQRNFEHDIKQGLAFFMDYNEDRQISMDATVNSLQSHGLVGGVDESHDDEKGYMYLNTIGELIFNSSIFTV